MRPLNRIVPGLPVQAFKTYQLLAPARTHYRPASCAEVGCPHHEHGWATTVAAGGPDEAAVRASGRRFTVEPVEGGFLRFTFPAGQACFRASAHRVPLEREPIYIARGGDWRGNPTGQRTVHANARDWVDDFGEHQQRLTDQQRRG